MLTLVPAYGRDYESRASILKDWDADKDFMIVLARIGVDTIGKAEDGLYKVRYKRGPSGSFSV